MSETGNIRIPSILSAIKCRRHNRIIKFYNRHKKAGPPVFYMEFAKKHDL